MTSPALAPRTNRRRAAGGLRAAADVAFAAAFSRMLIYTILFEDNAVDLDFLALTRGDRVLTISGAGCGVAAMMGAGAATIDAVDINRHHLALTALKVSAATTLGSYDELHALFGLGRHHDAERVVAGLAAGMPADLGAYWTRRSGMFASDFYAHGLSSWNLGLARRFSTVTPEILRQLHREPRPEARSEVLRAVLVTSLARPVPAMLVRSPLALLGAGINYTQRERNLRALGAADVVTGVVDYVARLATTDLATNWIAWHIATGRFNHEDPTCLPLYLLPDNHARSLGSATRVEYHHASILNVLERADARTWSHYCLSDVVDWLDETRRARLFREVLRTARPGARVICRSVEEGDVVAEVGLEARLQLVEPFSTVASERERSRLYRRVNCYEVVA